MIHGKNYTIFSLEACINMITLYSTNCPKCKVLEMKMKKKNIEYVTYSDVDGMLAKGIKAAPVLELDDNTRLDFAAAVKWVNEK